MSNMQIKVQQLIGVMAEAEKLIIQDKNNPNLGFNKQFLDEVEKVYKKLKTFAGMQVSGALADNYSYAFLYLQDTLYIAGRVR